MAILDKSLPSRERGLKLLSRRASCPSTVSLPSRERGLKFGGAHEHPARYGSLPSRERGLKLRQSRALTLPEDVAPFTGAWIEMAPLVQGFLYSLVAPFTGAWIEISPTLRTELLACVAPFTGAWIEIPCLLVFSTSQPCRSLHGSVD